MQIEESTEQGLLKDDFNNEIIKDYRIAVTSRECSLLGRREVLTGKAKFGIFGDGKELPQLAWARAFKKGDWRSGYYRDQTFMMAIGELTILEEPVVAVRESKIPADPAARITDINAKIPRKI